MNYLFLGFIGLIFLFCILLIWNKKKQNQDIAYRVSERFGKSIDLDDEEEPVYRNQRYLKHLSFYTRLKGSLLDDTTKSDIDFDKLFAKINHTYSSVGEEYLYYIMSNPIMSNQKLEEREKIITYFQENQDQAVKMQILLGKIGKKSDISMFQYLEYLKTVEGTGLKKHILAFIGIIITVILSVINPKIGLVPMFVVIIINVVTYWSNRIFAQSVMGSIRSLEAMIQASVEISHYKNQELEYFTKRLIKGKDFQRIFKNSGWLFSEKTSLASDADAFLDYIRMLSHVDYVKLNQILDKLQEGYETLYTIAETLGELESLIAIASFRESLEYYSVPILNEWNNIMTSEDNGLGKKRNSSNDCDLIMDELYHPLIHNPVVNTLHTNKGVLLTGSNASGKSTFLRTVVINAICAQSIHTCFAKHYESPFFIIRSAMSLKDSLENGDSYFIVEIEMVRDILMQSNNVPIMCFVDEILRGTNTIERIAAATEILRYMNNKGIRCFAASHDIELTKLLKHEYDMYHFQEYIEDGKVAFDYVLHPGPVTTRNAIRLLEMKEYDDIIINNAMDLIDYFEKHGEWPCYNEV